MSIPSEIKSLLRLQLRQTLHAISPAERIVASSRICEQVSSQPFWRASRRILAFVPTRHEPDIWPLINELMAAGKNLGFPRYDAGTAQYEVCEVQNPTTDLRPGRFGILEPDPKCPGVPLNQLDLALVPGLGFAPNGNRIGRGNGYYDRLLMEVRGTKCGIAFDLQIVPTIPVESHDVCMDVVITESRCLRRS